MKINYGNLRSSLKNIIDDFLIDKSLEYPHYRMEDRQFVMNVLLDLFVENLYIVYGSNENRSFRENVSLLELLTHRCRNELIWLLSNDVKTNNLEVIKDENP